MPWAEALAEPSTLVFSWALDSIVFISDVKRGHLSDKAVNETSVSYVPLLLRVLFFFLLLCSQASTKSPPIFPFFQKPCNNFLQCI